MTAKFLPVVFLRIFPATKPFQAISDVADFISINAFQQARGIHVSDRCEFTSEIRGKIEIGLLESEAKAGYILHRALHVGNGVPEIAAHRELAEANAALLHAADVEPCVFLLILEGLQ